MPNQSKSTSTAEAEPVVSRTARTATVEMQPSQDLADYLKEYARERPEVAALWCVGIGFILGWKLKPW
jgi:hypothetical protein